MSQAQEEPPFFWLSPALEQRLDLLLHLIEFGQQAVVLAGPEGSGKTALLTELLQRAPENWSWAMLDGAAAATTEEVVERLAEAWEPGLVAEAGGDGDSTEGLMTVLSGWARRDRVPVILLDDADRANDALLVSLLNIVSRLGARCRPRLLLVGRPVLEARLASSPLRGLLAGMPHSLEMPPLEEPEVADYLAARQQADGLRGVRLPPDAVRRLHRETGGLPGPLYARFVRAVAAVAAAEAEPAERVAKAPALGAPQARKYALVMGLVAFIFVTSLLVRALLWRDPAPEAVGESAGSVIDTLVLPPLDVQAPATPIVSFPEQGRAVDDGKAAATGSEPPIAVTDRAPGQVAGAESGASAIALAPPEPDGPGATGEPTAGGAEAIAPLPGPSVDPVREMPPPPEDAPRQATAPGKKADERDPVAAPEPPSRPSPPPASVEAPPRASPSVAAAAGADLAWLARLDDGAWLLQVFASDRLPAARSAIARHGLEGKARVIPTTRDGKPWYVVVVGPYPDRARASAALATLPQALRAQGPFPRRAVELQRVVPPTR